MHKAKTAKEFFGKAPLWRNELGSLRKILVASGLEEEVKWGAPCYTLNGVNIVGVGAFKSYFGLWFYQGALLKDREGMLVNAQEGRTKAMRQWRMMSALEINPALIARYVEEAKKLAEAGKKVEKTPKKLVMPDDLKKALAGDKKAQLAFEALSPGRQREYAVYVNEAKQAVTRSKRIEKILPMIAAGTGLNDRYKNC